MIPASMSVDGEHAVTYRQQHGSPNIFFHWIKFFLQKIYKGNVLVIDRTIDLRGLIQTLYRNMSGC